MRNNHNFFNGSKLEQDPFYTIQGHIIYTFRPGFWLRGSAGYGFGGETKVDGVENDNRKGSLAWTLSAGYPIARRLGVKVVYANLRAQEPVGRDSDALSVSLVVIW